MWSLIPFTGILSLLLIMLAKGRSIYSISIVVLSIYAFCFGVSVILEAMNIHSISSVFELSIFTITIFLYLVPLYFFDERSFSAIIFPASSLFKAAMLGIGVLSVFAFIYFLPNIANVLKTQDISGYRSLVNKGEEVMYEKGFIAGLFIYICQMYVVCIALAIWSYLFVNKYPKILSLLLIIGSLSMPLYVVSNFGRDGIIRWGICFICFLLMVRRFFAVSSKLAWSFCGGVVGIGLMYVVIIISIGRFSGREFSMWFYIFDYLGQMPFNYVNSAVLSDDFSKVYGRNTLGLFYHLLDRNAARYDAFVIGLNILELHTASGYRTNVFGTFLKSNIWDFGRTGNILIAFIPCLYFYKKWKKVRKLRVLPFSLALLSGAYATFIGQGVFYNIWTGVSGNFLILFLLSFSALSAFFEHRGEVHILKIKQARPSLGKV